MFQAEHLELRFKVKEGIGNVWIDAEPQSENGGIPFGIAGMGLTLYTTSTSEAERIADFFNNNVNQVFFVKEGTKCME